MKYLKTGRALFSTKILFFWLCFGSIIFSISKELRFVNWMRFFEWNCIVKSVIFFAGFYRLWDFLLQILEWKKLIMSTGLVEIIFSKKSYKYQILNHLYFGPSFVFRGTALGRFSQCFFFNFLPSVNHGFRRFYSTPPPPPPP